MTAQLDKVDKMIIEAIDRGVIQVYGDDIHPRHMRDSPEVKQLVELRSQIVGSQGNKRLTTLLTEALGVNDNELRRQNP